MKLNPFSGLFAAKTRGNSRSGASDAMLAACVDGITTNVMIADADLNIVYMNEHVSAFLSEAQEDIRRVLPQFDAKSLVGRSIDTFHKNPDHQRKMLKALTGTHRATIQVGTRKFDLIANPILDKGGRRLGTVVEWADANQRLALEDFTAQMDALGKSQAIIEFELDGTIVRANDLFLKVMGYTEDEIRGKHHSIFVDTAEVKSPAYEAFWESLRRGEFQNAEFRRVGKAGREVWIQGTYNPIRDTSGKVYKVVKFATDITDMVKRRQEAERVGKLVDASLEQILSAVESADQRSASAASAANDTSSTVQAVATAASQFDASTQEIARSMNVSRAAVEKAMAETEAVGNSTRALADAAESMNGIVELIQEIAGQINLLALNATIESARAGEAGKGFAVVATEVKNLAGQVAGAISQISGEISNVQTVSGEVVQRILQIGQDVASVHEGVTVVASAIDEQTATSQEITSNMQSAAAAVSDINKGLAEISSAVQTTNGHAKEGMKLYRSLNADAA